MIRVDLVKGSKLQYEDAIDPRLCISGTHVYVMAMENGLLTKVLERRLDEVDRVFIQPKDQARKIMYTRDWR